MRAVIWPFENPAGYCPDHSTGELPCPVGMGVRAGNAAQTMEQV